jgi:hypothetical protein
MKDVDSWLAELAHAMGGTLAEQQAVRDEFRAHIREGAREHQIDGMNSEEAVRRALDDLGEPAALGRSLRDSRGMPAVRRPLSQPEGALILERRIQRRLSLTVTAAFAALAGSSLLIAALYLWPS